MKRTILVTSATVLLGFALSTVANAHTKVPNGGWYFRGTLFKDNDDGREARSSARKDPVNVIWYGGPSFSSVYSLNNVEVTLNSFWDTRTVGGSPWRTHKDIAGYCKVDQLAHWVHMPGRSSDRTDRHGSTAKRKRICGKQHHMRLWDDVEHDRGTRGEHDGPVDGRNAWALGGVHYDKVSSPSVGFDCGRFGCAPSINRGITHVPGRSWIVTRHQMRRALHRLCGERAWKYHSGAAGWYQGYYNNGYIARMTLRPKAVGCAGSGPPG